MSSPSDNGMSITRTFIRISKIKVNDKIKNINIFGYKNNDCKCTKKEIERIKKLGIPPNWKSVCISNSELSHLQATGIDDKGRTQYIYHPMWVLLTSAEKYNRMGEFSKKIGLLESKIRQDLNSKDCEIPIMFRILQKTYIRVGNDCYAKDNNTYGLTTLEKRHITISKSNINLSFVGKKGVAQSTNFKDPYCLNYLKDKLKLLKSNDCVFNTSPTTLNNYLQSVMESDFTCKDFRTYGSNVMFLTILCKLDTPKTQKEIKDNLKYTYDEVAKKLGHTRAISKKSYVMGVISDQYILNPTQFNKKNPKTLFKMLCV